MADTDNVIEQQFDLSLGETFKKVEEISKALEGMHKQFEDMPNYSDLLNSSLARTEQLADTISKKIDRYNSTKFSNPVDRTNFAGSIKSAVSELEASYALQSENKYFSSHMAEGLVKGISSGLRKELDSVFVDLAGELRKKMSPFESVNKRNGVAAAIPDVLNLSMAMLADKDVQGILKRSIKQPFNDKQMLGFMQTLVAHAAPMPSLNEYSRLRYRRPIDKNVLNQQYPDPLKILPKSFADSFASGGYKRRTSETPKFITEEARKIISDLISENPVAVIAAERANIVKRGKDNRLRLNRNIEYQEYELLRQAMYNELESRVKGSAEHRLKDIYSNSPGMQQAVAKRLLSSSSSGTTLAGMKRLEALEQAKMWRTDKISGAPTIQREAKRDLERYDILSFSPFLEGYKDNGRRHVSLMESVNTRLLGLQKRGYNGDASDIVSTLRLDGYDPKNPEHVKRLKDIFTNGYVIKADNGEEVRMRVHAPHRGEDGVILRLVSEKAMQEVNERISPQAKRASFIGTNYWSNFNPTEGQFATLEEERKNYDARNKGWTPSAALGTDLSNKKIVVADLVDDKGNKLSDGAGYISQNLLNHTVQGRGGLGFKGILRPFTGSSFGEVGHKAGAVTESSDGKKHLWLKGLDGKLVDAYDAQVVLDSSVIKALPAFRNADGSYKSNEEISKMVASTFGMFPLAEAKDFDAIDKDSDIIGSQAMSFFKVTPEMRKKQAEQLIKRLRELDTEEGMKKYVFPAKSQDYLSQLINGDNGGVFLQSYAAQDRIAKYKQDLVRRAASGEYIDFGEDSLSTIRNTGLATSPMSIMASIYGVNDTMKAVARKALKEKLGKDYSDQEIEDIIKLRGTEFDEDGKVKRFGLAVDFEHKDQDEIGAVRSPTALGNYIVAKNVAKETEIIYQALAKRNLIGGEFYNKDFLDASHGLYLHPDDMAILQGADWDGDTAKVVTGNLKEMIKNTINAYPHLDNAATKIPFIQKIRNGQVADSPEEFIEGVSDMLLEAQGMGAGSGASVRPMQLDLTDPLNNKFLYASYKGAEKYNDTSTLYKHPGTSAIDKDVIAANSLGKEWSKFAERFGSVFNVDDPDLYEIEKDENGNPVLDENGKQIKKLIEDPSRIMQIDGKYVNMDALRRLDLRHTNLPSMYMDSHVMGLMQLGEANKSGLIDMSNIDLLAKAITHIDDYTEDSNIKNVGPQAKKLMETFDQLYPQFLSGLRTRTTKTEEDNLKYLRSAANREIIKIAEERLTHDNKVKNFDDEEVSFSSFIKSMQKSYGLNRVDNFLDTFGFTEDRIQYLPSSIQRFFTNSDQSKMPVLEEKLEDNYTIPNFNNLSASIDESKKAAVKARENLETVQKEKEEAQKQISDSTAELIKSLGVNKTIAKTLESADPQELRYAIVQGKKDYFTEFPGIGEKTAAKIIKNGQDKFYSIGDPEQVDSNTSEKTFYDSFDELSMKHQLLEDQFEEAKERVKEFSRIEEDSVRRYRDQQIYYEVFGSANDFYRNLKSGLNSKQRSLADQTQAEQYYNKQYGTGEMYKHMLEQIPIDSSSFNDNQRIAYREIMGNIDQSIREDFINKSELVAKSTYEDLLNHDKKTNLNYDKLEEQVDKYAESIKTAVEYQIQLNKLATKFGENTDIHKAFEAASDSVGKYIKKSIPLLETVRENLYAKEALLDDKNIEQLEKFTRNRKKRYSSSKFEKQLLLNEQDYATYESQISSLRSRMSIWQGRKDKLEKQNNTQGKSYAIATQAIEKYSNAISYCEKQMASLTGVSGTANAALTAIGTSVNQVLTRMGNQLFHRAAQEAINFTKTYDASMTEIQMVTLKTDEEINSLGEKIISTAKDLKTSIPDIASTVTALYRQGLGDSQVQERLDDVIKFSKTANVKPTDALKMITVAMNGKMVNGTSEAIDVVSALGDSAATEAAEITKGLQKTMFAAKEVGVSYKELVAMLTVITSKTQLGGSVAGTTLKNIFSRISRVGKGDQFIDEDGHITSLNDLSQVLTPQGISLFDGDKLRNAYDILADIGSIWNEISDAERLSISYALGGTRQFSNVAALMQGFAELDEAGNNIMQKYVDIANASDGITDEKYANYTESLAASLNNLTTSFDSLISSISENDTLKKFLDFLSSGLSGLTKINEQLDKAPSRLLSIATAFAAIAGLLKVNPALFAILTGAGFILSLGNTYDDLSKKTDYNEIQSKIDERYDKPEKYIKIAREISEKKESGETLTQKEESDFKFAISSLYSMGYVADDVAKQLLTLQGSAKDTADALDAAAKSASNKKSTDILESAGQELSYRYDDYLNAENDVFNQIFSESDASKNPYLMAYSIYATGEQPAGYKKGLRQTRHIASSDFSTVMDFINALEKNTEYFNEIKTKDGRSWEDLSSNEKMDIIFSTEDRPDKISKLFPKPNANGEIPDQIGFNIQAMKGFYSQDLWGDTSRDIIYNTLSSLFGTEYSEYVNDATDYLVNDLNKYPGKDPFYQFKNEFGAFNPNSIKPFLVNSGILTQEKIEQSQAPVSPLEFLSGPAANSLLVNQGKGFDSEYLKLFNILRKYGNFDQQDIMLPMLSSQILNWEDFIMDESNSDIAKIWNQIFKYDEESKTWGTTLTPSQYSDSIRQIRDIAGKKSSVTSSTSGYLSDSEMSRIALGAFDLINSDILGDRNLQYQNLALTKEGTLERQNALETILGKDTVNKLINGELSADGKTYARRIIEAYGKNVPIFNPTELFGMGKNILDISTQTKMDEYLNQMPSEVIDFIYSEIPELKTYVNYIKDGKNEKANAVRNQVLYSMSANRIVPGPYADKASSILANFYGTPSQQMAQYAEVDRQDRDLSNAAYIINRISSGEKNKQEDLDFLKSFLEIDDDTFNKYLTTSEGHKTLQTKLQDKANDFYIPLFEAILSYIDPVVAESIRHSSFGSSIDTSGYLELLEGKVSKYIYDYIGGLDFETDQGYPIVTVNPERDYINQSSAFESLTNIKSQREIDREMLSFLLEGAKTKTPEELDAFLDTKNGDWTKFWSGHENLLNLKESYANGSLSSEDFLNYVAQELYGVSNKQNDYYAPAMNQLLGSGYESGVSEWGNVLTNYNLMSEIDSDSQFISIVEELENGPALIDQMTEAYKKLAQGEELTKNDTDALDKALKAVNDELKEKGIKNTLEYNKALDNTIDIYKGIQEGGKDAAEAVKKLYDQGDAIQNAKWALNKYKSGNRKDKQMLKSLSSQFGFDENELKKATDEEAAFMIENMEQSLADQDIQWSTAAETNVNEALSDYMAQAAEIEKPVDLQKYINIDGSVDVSGLTQAFEDAGITVNKAFTNLLNSLNSLGAKFFLNSTKDGFSVKTSPTGRKGSSSKYGGGSSGGSKKSYADKLTERLKHGQSLYDHQIKMIQYQQTKYQNADELGNYGNMLREEIAVEQTYLPVLQSTLNELKSAIAATSTGTEDWYKLRDAILDTEERYEEVNKAIAENKKKLEENHQAILKLHTDLEEMIVGEIEARIQAERDQLDGSVDMQDVILESIKRRYQDEWDLVKKDVEKKKEALEAEKSLIDERLNARKNAEDEAAKYEELAELKKQLAIISMDSTRTKDAAELRESISQLESEIGWDIAEKQAENEKQGIQDQIDAYDDYVTKGDEDLEQLLEDSNNFSQEVNEVLKLNQSELFDWLKQNVKEYSNSLDDAQKQMVNGWTDTYKQMLGITDVYWDQVNEILSGKSSFLDYMKESEEYKNASEDEKAQLLYQWGDAYDKWVLAQKQEAEYHHTDPGMGSWSGSEYNGSSSGSSGGSGGGGSSSKKPSSGGFFGALDKLTNDKEGAIHSGKEWMDSHAPSKNPIKNIWDSITEIFTGNKNKPDKIGKLPWNVPNGKLPSQGKKKIIKNATGGLADYTGLTWVDGTFDKPERILSPEQTKSFNNMVDIMDDFRNKGLTSDLVHNMLDWATFVKVPSSLSHVGSDSFEGNISNIGDVYVTLNEAQINDDRDYDEIADIVGQKFVKEISKQGLNITKYSF